MHQAPLLFLCEHSTAVEPVQAFLEHHRAEVKDVLSFVAHCACRNTSAAALEIINMLRGVDKQKVKRKKKEAIDKEHVHKKQKRDHLILTPEESISIFRSVESSTKQHLPLHTICITKHKLFQTAEVVRAVISAHPAGLLVHDASGRLPLELACQNSLTVARAVMQAQPILKDCSEQTMALYCAALTDKARHLVQALLMVQRRPRQGSAGLDALPMEVLLIVIKHLCAILIATGGLDGMASFAARLSKCSRLRHHLAVPCTGKIFPCAWD